VIVRYVILCILFVIMMLSAATVYNLNYVWLRYGMNETEHRTKCSTGREKDEMVWSTGPS